MQRIQTSDDNAFHDGSATTGQLGTVVNSAWLNGVQEELMSVIEGAGLTPSGANNAQLLAALQALLSASSTPAGAVAHFARATAPSGWLKANGAEVSRTTYANLYAAIGTTFGAGDGSTTFKLPDLRGEFLRALDDGRGIDSSRTLGSSQDGAIQSHTHSLTLSAYSLNALTSNHGWGGDDVANGTYTNTTSATGGTETRPRNIALLACIKF